MRIQLTATVRYFVKGKTSDFYGYEPNGRVWTNVSGFLGTETYISFDKEYVLVAPFLPDGNFIVIKEMYILKSEFEGKYKRLDPPNEEGDVPRKVFTRRQ